MVWIKLRTHIFHDKRCRLGARHLKIPVAAFVGHLHALWLAAMEATAKNWGGFHGWECKDVEQYAGWQGAPGAMYQALSEQKFIEKRFGQLDFIDWDDFSGPYLKPQGKRKLRGNARGLFLNSNKRTAWNCAICGVNLDVKSLRVDHIKPVSRGGLTENSNLQALCEPCNQLKGST